MIRSFVFLLLALCICSYDAVAQWKKIAELPCRIRIIRMLDENVGFIGTGEVPTNDPIGTVGIFKTTDGGATWRQMITPDGARGVIDISMVTPERGWAAIYRNSGSILWKTTDGGERWVEDRSIDGKWGQSVFETSAALVVCDFYGQIHWSTDKGSSWKKEKRVDDAYLHLCFMDDKNGVLGSYRGSGVWAVTSDGGLTWTDVAKKDESWSIYADKKNRIYYAAPEGDSRQSFFWKSKVWKSSDMGHNWVETAQFSFRTTGHLDGNDGTLYIQTNELGCRDCGDENAYKRGIYKSINEGVDWVHIGGPDGLPDTRFEVLPLRCGGNILFVQRDREVWKFIDGEATTGIEIDAKPQATIKGIDEEVPLPLAISFNASAQVEKFNVRKITFTLRFDTSIVFIDRDRAREIYEPPAGWILSNMMKLADGVSISIIDTVGVGITTEQSLGVLKIVPQSPKDRNTTVTLVNVVLLDGENALNNACLLIESDYITNVLVEQGSADVAGFATPKTRIGLVPNPARNTTTLTLTLREASEVDFGIYDILGKEMHRHRTNGTIYPTGIYTFQLPLNELAAGQYFVRVTADDRILIEGLTVY